MAKRDAPSLGDRQRQRRGVGRALRLDGRPPRACGFHLSRRRESRLGTPRRPFRPRSGRAPFGDIFGFQDELPPCSELLETQFWNEEVSNSCGFPHACLVKRVWFTLDLHLARACLPLHRFDLQQHPTTHVLERNVPARLAEGAGRLGEN